MMKMKIVVALAALGLLAACGGKKTEPAPVVLIPMPVKNIPGEGIFYLKSGSTISADASLMEAAGDIAGIIAKSNGLNLTVNQSEKKGDITLRGDLQNENPEAYTFEVGKDGIVINGSTVRGVIMGVSTLQQLLPANAESGAAISYVKIEDQPYFKWRGMHLDVSRHFYTVDEVKGFIDLLNRYKMNKFHWHLTDDQGWRAEIKKYPRLTEVGGWRKLNRWDRDCQKAAREQDDPTLEMQQHHMKINGTDTIYGGFYTQDQMREVVKYAAARGIDIVPEIDMPGHFSAAMTGYPDISCFGGVEWTELFANPLCPGKDEVVQMCKDIWTELADIFPYEYFNVGGDEVDKSFWKKCPNCKHRIQEEGLKDYDELQSWFIHEIEAHLTVLGRKMIGWDEILEGGLSKTATILWWRNWAPDAVWRATAQGSNAIYSPAFTLYFDGVESGEGTIEGVFNYNPLVPHVSAEMAEMVYRVDPAHVVLSPEQQKLVLGLQANIWCEFIPSVERMQYQIMPRMMAVSEIAWRDPFAARDFAEFQQRYIRHIDYLDAKNINYYIPEVVGAGQVNVFVDTVSVVVASPLPNIVLRYTTDGSTPTADSKAYDGPIVIDQSTAFTFRPFRPNGTCGRIFTVEYRKENYSAADPSASLDGFKVVHYEYKGKKAAEIETAGRKLREFATDTIGLPEGAKGYMGLIFSGYIEVPADDIYTFVLTSDDGSNLYIDDAEVINYDGEHGPNPKSGQKALKAGKHKVRVEYFDANNGGMVRLQMKGKADKEPRTVLGK